MIRYEAVITALIGAILGMVLGLVLAALIAQPLKDEGFTLSYPIGSLVVLLVFAALAGVLAAILPARRASRLDVLEVAAVRVGAGSVRYGGTGLQARPIRSAPAASSIAARAERRDRGQVGEAVDQAGVAAQRDLDAGLAHPRRVGLALVAQRVEAGGGDVGGRQAGEVGGAQHRDARVVARRAVAAGSGLRTSPCRAG